MGAATMTERAQDYRRESIDVTAAGIAAITDAARRHAAKHFEVQPPEPAAPVVLALEAALALIDQAYNLLPDADRRELAAEYVNVRAKGYDVLLMDSARVVARCRYCGRPLSSEGPFCSQRCMDDFEHFIG